VNDCRLSKLLFVILASIAGYVPVAFAATPWVAHPEWVRKGTMVSIAALMDLGYSQKMAVFGNFVSIKEGGFNSVNQFGCVGFIQWCPGTFGPAFGGEYVAPAPPTVTNSQLTGRAIPSEQLQANAARGYFVSEWTNGGQNYTSLIGREVCVRSNERLDQQPPCERITITQGSIMTACLFGCRGAGAKLAGWKNNGNSCTGASSARDGNGKCVQDYLVDGAKYDVSEITSMKSDELNAVRKSDGKIIHSDKIANGQEDDEAYPLPGNTGKLPSGMTPPPKCASLNLMGAMVLASKGYQNAAIAAGQQAYKQLPVSNMLGCIFKLQTYFSNISSILSGLLNVIVGVLLAIVSSVINAICKYVVDAVTTVLEMICLPIPNLGFSLSMPSTSSGYCNGLSLGSFISVSGRGGMFPSGMPMMSVPPNMSLGAQYYQRRSQ
jgi:hypothetical protein